MMAYIVIAELTLLILLCVIGPTQHGPHDRKRRTSKGSESRNRAKAVMSALQSMKSQCTFEISFIQSIEQRSLASPSLCQMGSEVREVP